MLTLATGSSWEPVTYAPVCALKPGADREKVFAWLRGSGEVIFGSMPGFGFEARLMNQIDFRQVFEAVGAYGTFSPVFSCQPLRHQVPQEGKIVCTNGMKLTNPGNVASRPKISVFCTGSVTMSLAGQAVHLTGQTGGSVLDCEAEDCYSGDFLSLAESADDGRIPDYPGGHVVHQLGSGRGKQRNEGGDRTAMEVAVMELAAFLAGVEEIAATVRAIGWAAAGRTAPATVSGW